MSIALPPRGACDRWRGARRRSDANERWRRVLRPPGEGVSRALVMALGAWLCGAHGPSAAGQATADEWFASGQAAVARRLAERPVTNRARNIVLFLGDGMGITTVTSARVREGQLRGESGEENLLAFETLPHTALVKTYNTDQQVADSAGTMTAIMSGAKTRAGVLGLGPGITRGAADRGVEHVLPTLLEICEARGMKTGIVTTTRVTHATPAACFAHISHRDWESDADLPDAARDAGVVDIARQLVEFPWGDGVDVILGGGARAFRPAAQGGARGDGRDLLREWTDARPGRVLVRDADALASVPRAGQVFGVFADSNLPYEVDADASVPTLAQMTRVALDVLGAGESGYFLMIEGGRIDHAHHGGNAHRALSETIAFSDAVRVVLERTRADDTLVLVTADHSHVLTMAGYPARGADILGHAVTRAPDGRSVPQLDATNRPYTTLGYANGPGARSATHDDPGPAGDSEHEDDGASSDTTARDYRQASLVPLASETHGGEDVAAYARGPWAHLVRGVLEQHVLFHVMLTALDPPPTDG